MVNKFSSQKSPSFWCCPSVFWQHGGIVNSLISWLRITLELQRNAVIHFLLCSHFTCKFYSDPNFMLSISTLLDSAELCDIPFNLYNPFLSKTKWKGDCKKRDLSWIGDRKRNMLSNGKKPFILP